MSSPRYAKAQQRTPLRREFAGLWRAFKAPFGSYRPECHYMRGPGPKWHAKHTPITTSDIEVPALARTA